MTLHAKTPPSPPRRDATARAQRLQQGPMSLPTAHERSGSAPASSGTPTSNSSHDPGVIRFVADHSFDEELREAAEARTAPAGPAPNPAAPCTSNEQTTPALARELTATATAAGPRRSSPSPHPPHFADIQLPLNAAHDTRDGDLAPEVNQDVMSLMEDDCGVFFDWTAPTLAASPDPVEAGRPQRPFSPPVLVRVDNTLEDSDSTPPLMLSPPRCPPPPLPTTTATTRPHPPSAVKATAAAPAPAPAPAPASAAGQGHPPTQRASSACTPSGDGSAPAPCAATAASADPSSTQPAPPPAAARDRSSTPAAAPLRRCRIPPMAPLDGPQKRRTSSQDNVAVAASSSNGLHQATSTAAPPAAPPAKRGSRLNTAFANVGKAAQGTLPHMDPPRPVRIPRVSFKEGDVVALPDSTALRTPMMAVPAEVYAQLLERGTAVRTLAVVDEDAVRRPCLVASGFCVRVFEKGRAPGRGAAKVLHGFRNRMRSGGGGGGGGGSRDGDSVGSRSSAEAVSDASSGPSTEVAAASSGTNVMMPDKRARQRRSSENFSDAHSSEFDRFLHKVVFDEALSRPKAESGCDSVTLQLLARRWEAGQNSCLAFGSGSGRSIQCFDVAVGVVKDAMAKLRARLRDPTSTAELQMRMGDVFADTATGAVRVQDLLVWDDDSDSVTSSSASDAAAVLHYVPLFSAEEKEQRRFPSVRLARSPLMGTFVKGLSVVTAADALCDASCIFGALGRGFHQYNVSTHSSRSGSFSSQSSGRNIATLGAHTCFAVLRLRTICRGRDMRSAPLSAREATAVGEERVPRKQHKKVKKGALAAPVTHHRTTECAADVFVSTLLLTFFGTEYHIFKTIVENKLIDSKQARGGAFVLSAEQLTFSPTTWTDPVHFLYSLLRDGLGGRTHTVTCLCLSEYDSHVTPWLHVMERARAILNSAPNNGNLLNCLHYLLEQYENLETQQRREKKGLGARRAATRAGTSAAGSAAQPGEISMYFVQKLVSSLDRYLAVPVGEPSLLERLEVKSADTLPPVLPNPLPRQRAAQSIAAAS